jgi:plasmid stability protein
MTTLTIRGLDDKVIEQLKERARTRRRSLEAELRTILIQASSQPLILDALAEADRIAAMTPGKALPSDAAPEAAPTTPAPMQMGGEP